MRTPEERQKHMIDRVLQQKLRSHHQLSGVAPHSDKPSKPAELIIPAKHFKPNYPKPGKLTVIKKSIS